MNTVTVIFPALSENEPFARSVVAAYCMRFDPTLDELSDVKTAVSEAVTNCIVHAYAGTERGDVRHIVADKLRALSLSRQICAHCRTHRACAVDCNPHWLSPFCLLVIIFFSPLKKLPLHISIKPCACARLKPAYCIAERTVMYLNVKSAVCFFEVQ